MESLEHTINGKGLLLVIDGTDGSGKATQAEILRQRLAREGYDVEMINFPQYGKKSAGPVEEYLNGKYGSGDQVGPYQASVLYAVDRFDASFQIRNWLEQGKIVISNRYVTANMAHQGGKLADKQARSRLFQWLHEFEFELFGLPKPDANIILHVEAEVAQQMVDSKSARSYIENGGKRDIHENDLAHLKAAEKVYIQIANELSGYSLIPCTKNGKILSREEIHELVWRRVSRLLPAPPPLFRAPDFKKLHEDQLRSFQKSLAENEHEPVEFSVRPEAMADDRNNKHMPQQGHKQSNGVFVLRARDYYTVLPGEHVRLPTGLRVRLPDECVGMIWGARELSEAGVNVLTEIVEDPSRQEIKVNAVNLGQDNFNIAPGQVIGRLVVQKAEDADVIEFI